MDERTFWLLVAAVIALLIPAVVVIAGVVWVVHRLLCERRGAALPESVPEDW